MKRLLFKAAIVFLAISAYIGAPFATAWSIREAVRNGDSVYLERAIDWPSIRETLKPTLARLAFDMPDPETQPNVKPSMWQRFKAYWGGGAMNRAIDGYITPEGLPKLFAMRKAYRNYTGAEDEGNTLPVTERMKRFWSRMKRAEFTSLTAFEVDMADKHDPNRIYLGKLELTGTGWILRELRIKYLMTADGATQPSTQQQFMSIPRATGQLPTGNTWSTGFISRAEAAPAPQQPTGFFARAKAAARGALHSPPPAVISQDVILAREAQDSEPQGDEAFASAGRGDR
jgi:Protein of unknown function (DUF2939)